MSDLRKYISKRKAVDAAFNDNYEEGYQAFKISALLRQAREALSLAKEPMINIIKYKNH